MICEIRGQTAEDEISFLERPQGLWPRELKIMPAGLTRIRDGAKKPDAGDSFYKLEFVAMSLIDCLRRTNESVPAMSPSAGPSR